MTREKHIRLIEGVRADKRLSHFVCIADKTSVVLIVLSYVALLGYLQFVMAFGKYLVPGCVLIPFISFVVFSLIRKVLNRPRPYKVYGIEPIMPRSKDGESFPSRHVFSAFLISVTYINVDCTYAALIGILGIFLAVLRVCEGTHFVKDVVVGAVAGIMCGLVGYSLYYYFYFEPIAMEEIKNIFNNMLSGSRFLDMLFVC